MDSSSSSDAAKSGVYFVTLIVVNIQFLILLGDLAALLGTVLKNVEKQEVLDYLSANEVEAIDHIKVFGEKDLDSLLLGILPTARRLKVQAVLRPLVSMY